MDLGDTPEGAGEVCFCFLTIDPGDGSVFWGVGRRVGGWMEIIWKGFE